MNELKSIYDTLPKRIPDLDGVRGLAILLVLIFHAFGFVQNSDNLFIQELISFSRLGYSGVMLFFVLSGFLIGGILIDNYGAANYFKVFYLRRSLRIFPLYYALLITVCSFVFARKLGLFITPDWLFGFRLPAWSYLTFTQNFLAVHYHSLGASSLGATWSLAVEEQFYLILPFVIRFVPRKVLVPLLIIIALVCRPVLMISYPEYGELLLWLMPFHADSLLMGVLLAIAVRSPKGSMFLLKYRKVLGLLTLIFLVLLLIPNSIYKMTDATASSVLSNFGIAVKLRFPSMIAPLYSVLIILTLTAQPHSLINHWC